EALRQPGTSWDYLPRLRKNNVVLRPQSDSRTRCESGRLTPKPVKGLARSLGKFPSIEAAGTGNRWDSPRGCGLRTTPGRIEPATQGFVNRPASGPKRQKLRPYPFLLF